MSKIPSTRLLQVVLALLLFAGSVYIASTPDASVVQWYNNDDGFFYFKTAQNIVAGKGITFDGINPTNGFHPLWMAICVGVFSLVKGSLIAPLRVIILVFGLLYTGSGLFLFKGLNRFFSAWVSFCLTLGLLTSWFVYTYTFSGGLESGLSCFMLLWLWSVAVRWKEEQQREPSGLIWLGVIAAVTVMSRLDNIFVVGLLGIWLVIRDEHTRAKLFGDLTAGLIIPIITTILRTGFGVFHHYHFVLITTGLLLVITIPALYLLGFYSHPSRWLQQKTPFQKSIVIWVTTTVLTWAGTWMAFQMKWLDNFSVSILVIITVFWFGYVCLFRGLLLARPVTINANRMPDWKPMLEWLRLAAAYFAPIVLTLIGYWIWNLIVFHTPMPVSGQIKQWWGSLGHTTYGSPIQTWRELQEYLLSGDSAFGYLLNLPGIQAIAAIGKKWFGEVLVWVLLVCAGVWIWIQHHKANSSFWSDQLGLLPFGVAVIYRMAYFYISGYVHMRSWYWTVETIFIFLVLVLLLTGLKDRFAPSRQRVFVMSGILLAWTLVQVTTWVYNIQRVYPTNDSARNNRDYLVVPEMVAAATHPGAIIGTPGGGSLSYFIQDRIIVNLDGLMNSKEYFDALQQLDTHLQMRQSGVEYIFANQNTLLESSPYARIFANCVEPIQPIFGKTIFRYQCR